MPADFHIDMPNFSDEGDPLCAQTDPDLFFPVDVIDVGGYRGHATYYSEKTAKKICEECPYKIRCLDYALDNPDLLGIWGGTSDGERRKMRRSLGFRIK